MAWREDRPERGRSGGRTGGGSELLAAAWAARTRTAAWRGCAAASVAAVAIALLAPLAQAQRDAKGAWVGVLDEHPAIDYASRPTTDPIARLNTALGDGTAALAFEPSAGYLRALLTALDISPSSQLLVLSRTGVQRAYTRPSNPRALYFNEQVAIGYIPGAPYLELIAHDPVQGAVFYTLDQRATARPALSRQTACLTCHVATATLEVPGFMTRSLVAGPDGTPKLRLGSEDVVDHRTPFARRWGGFFVTGRHGQSTHLGNVVADERDVRRSLVPAGPLNVVSLAGVVNPDDYPAQTSDVAALAVFDHQTRALNLLTRLGWESRVAAHEGRAPATSPAVMALVRELVHYLLLADEAPMPGGLESTSGFREWFAARGPKDAQGRTLHALDLRRRLFAYPLSYTIDSPAFDALPADVRGLVVRAIVDALDGPPSGDGAVRIAAADRRAMLEILRATKPDAFAAGAR